MTIHDISELISRGLPWLHTKSGHKSECYFCGKPLTLPFVMWSCSGGITPLHTDCAMRFAKELLVDIARVRVRQVSDSRQHPIVFQEANYIAQLVGTTAVNAAEAMLDVKLRQEEADK